MSPNRKPVTAITMGDPAGIGPEIVLDTLMEPMIYEVADPFIIGSKKALLRAAEIKGLEIEINDISAPDEARFVFGIIDLLDPGAEPDAVIEYGKESREAALQAYSYLEKSIELGMNKSIDAVSTAPINKVSLRMAGVPHVGHTEIYQHLTGSAYALTMFHVHALRVFFLSRHVSLRDACNLVTKENVLKFIRDIDTEFRSIGFDDPSIAVAALNPHGGDAGMFGTEEIEELIPAVEQAKSEGINARGPLPADSIFAFALDGHHDCILSLYHDQGHIACKTLDFEKAVTLTLGLPFMRSSVDHGTAFDIAGKGIANGASMIESTRVVAEFAQRKMNMESNMS